MSNSISSDLGLAMTGGGARAAYQVGVLRYICKNFEDFHPPIITGVSAGAINAVHLASHPGPFADAVEHLAGLWLQLTADRVFRTDSRYFLANFMRWGLSLVLGGSRIGWRKRSLLDNDPLRKMLEKKLGAKATEPIGGIQENIERGRLRVLGITSTNYGTGVSITWIQGNAANTGGAPEGAVKMRRSPSSTSWPRPPCRLFSPPSISMAAGMETAVSAPSHPCPRPCTSGPNGSLRSPPDFRAGRPIPRNR